MLQRRRLGVSLHYSDRQQGGVHRNSAEARFTPPPLLYHTDFAETYCGFDRQRVGYTRPLAERSIIRVEGDREVCCKSADTFLLAHYAPRHILRQTRRDNAAAAFFPERCHQRVHIDFRRCLGVTECLWLLVGGPRKILSRRASVAASVSCAAFRILGRCRCSGARTRRGQQRTRSPRSTAATASTPTRSALRRWR